MTPERPGVLGAIGNTPNRRPFGGGRPGPTGSRAASTGASLDAALTVARRLGPEARVVAIQVDAGLKYLAGELYS